jgi:hypothetical protein
MLTSDEIAAMAAAHSARDERLSTLPAVLDRAAAIRALSEALESHRTAGRLLDALAAQAARAEAAESDWNDAIGYWHACAEALAAQTARAEAAEREVEDWKDAAQNAIHNMIASQDRERALAEAIAALGQRRAYWLNQTSWLRNIIRAAICDLEAGDHANALDTLRGAALHGQEAAADA